MKIMTFNLRFENDRDGDNSWVNRRRMVVDIINRYQPDILGTQEGEMEPAGLSGRLSAVLRSGDARQNYG
ncbi:MAG: hypothetical protein R2861_15425 [Desulfobacterales bacterium]